MKKFIIIILSCLFILLIVLSTLAMTGGCVEGITFSTKLQNYMKSPKMNSDKWVKYVDKVLFKDYAKSKGIDTPKIIAGPFDDANEINWEDLPTDYVIKLNNGSGRNIGVQNGKIVFYGLENENLKGFLVKDEKEKIKKQLNDWRRPYNPAGESWYKYIKPQIFIEEMINPLPKEYKLFLFNGKVEMIQDYDKDHKSGVLSLTHFDINWHNMNCNYIESGKKLSSKDDIPKPLLLNKLIKSAESLGEGLEFARIDFYVDNENIMGGEVTFAPTAGHVAFEPKSCDEMFSDFW